MAIQGGSNFFNGGSSPNLLGSTDSLMNDLLKIGTTNNVTATNSYIGKPLASTRSNMFTPTVGNGALPSIIGEDSNTPFNMQEFLASPTFANSIQALSMLGQFGQLGLGYAGLRETKDQFSHTRKMDRFNANNQVSTFNANAEAKAKQANFLSEGAVSREDLEKIKLKPLK